MEEYRVKTVDLTTKTIEPKRQTNDFEPPKIIKESNFFVRLLRMIFVSNWQIKLASIILAVVFWILLIFV